jgi:hypothetical protein
MSARIEFLASVIIAAAVCLALPAAALAGQGDAAMIPINVEINPSVPISSDLKANIIKVTEDLIRKNLPEIVAQSYRIDASANILEESPKGYLVEVIVVSLFKQSFTAQMSRITFLYKNGQASHLKVEQSSQPK